MSSFRHADLLPGISQVPELHGAVTTYAYNDTSVPATVTETTNGRWVKTSLDGLGRTIRVERGHGSTVVSITDTEYAPCACSPVGRVKRVSMPYAPGGTVSWTEYEFDPRTGTASEASSGSGRTSTHTQEVVCVWSVRCAGALRESTGRIAEELECFCLWRYAVR